jgi:hypothetical protein
MAAEGTSAPDGAAPSEPRLGPYRGPVVVLALVALVLVLGLAIAVVGAIRAPDDVSSSATILGTFPIDPDGEGIPPGPIAQPSTPSDTTPHPTTSSGPTTDDPPTTSGPAATTDGPGGSGAGEVEVVDAFDGGLGSWEQVGGDWTVADGALVAPEASDEAPAFLLAEGDVAGVGGEIGARARAAGLVVGYADPGTYVAALEVPSLGGWRIEVRVGGEVVEQASEVAPTAEGTVVQLGLADGEAQLVVDGRPVGTVAVPAGLGTRGGFVSRGPAGARWTAALAGP